MSWLWGKKDQEIEKENLVVREEKENDSHAAIEESPENSPSNSNKNHQDDDKHELRSHDHIDVIISDASFNENNASSYESSENDNSHDEDDDDDDDNTNDSSVETDDEEEHDVDISIVDGTRSQSTDDNSIYIDDLFLSDDDDDDYDDDYDDDDDDDDDGDGDGDEDNEQVSSLSEKKDMSKNNTGQDIPTTENLIHNNENNANAKYQPSDNDETDDEEDDDDEDVPTSFWEKQSLLVLAAEHDRVDILKALLTDENEEKDTLMNYGIPPLHLAISFGSVNTAQSLLRMGADPSIRPNIEKVLDDRKNQPKDSKVDIPNIRRFDSVTAWELAFGNKLYDENVMSNKSFSKSWSMFGTTATSEETNNTTTTTTRVIKPVDMAPSKREGIRHAFTAEALRSVGSDEVERLQQLIDSGMPADIELGGKDIYGWAIDMGALKCEELLRPVEAAKYETETEEQSQPATTGDEENKRGATEDSDRCSSSFVVHRPDAEETIPQLNNRLDELESLADALSSCLDNLAEEVSVCHGLLLMGGGASTLAAHVKSLRNLEYQKLNDLEDVKAEYEDAEEELFDLVQSTGDIGREIANIANFNITMPENKESNEDNSVEEQETEAGRLNIKAQIALSENKTRKLRASIADLSEENSRDLKEVERRGLHGGINLVRGLREELRDIEFNLSEARSMKTACKAKISMILARIPDQNNATDDATNITVVENMANDRIETQPKGEIIKSASIKDTENQETNDDEAVVVDYPSEIDASQQQNATLSQNGYPPKLISDSKSQQPQTPKTSSERIATGDSQAIAIIQAGNKGFFTVDLWNVILRIIGYDRAANRRSIQNTNNTSTGSSRPNQGPNVMII